MKKYFLAAAIAILALAGPATGSANAQSWFNRGGPTMIDRLVGNNGYYNGYANYGGYGNSPYGNYNYGNYGNYGNGFGRGRCHRFGNMGFGNMGYGNMGYGNMGYGNMGFNGWHHHHHHGRYW